MIMVMFIILVQPPMVGDDHRQTNIIKQNGTSNIMKLQPTSSIESLLMRAIFYIAIITATTFHASEAFENHPKCGQILEPPSMSNSLPTEGSFIVNGEDAYPGEFPWQTIMGREETSSFCGPHSVGAPLSTSTGS